MGQCCDLFATLVYLQFIFLEYKRSKNGGSYIKGEQILGV